MSKRITLPVRDDADALDYRVRRAAKAVIGSADRVLLVRERHADGRPYWTLPGGGVQSDESLAEGLSRELDEELRCAVVVDRPVTTVLYRHTTDPNTLSAYGVYTCFLLGEPTPARDEGVLDCRWADADALPPSTLPQVRYVIDRCRRFE